MFFLGRRIQLRRALQQMADDGHKQAKVALGSRKVFTALFEEVDGDYDRYCDECFGGPVTDFFDWLLKNGPAILELIMKIIAMFSEQDTGFAAWAARVAAAVLLAVTLGVGSASAELAPAVPSEAQWREMAGYGVNDNYPITPAVLGSQTFTAKATLAAAPVRTASHGRPVARAVRAVTRPVQRVRGLIRRLPVLRRLGSCGLRGCR